MRISVLAMMSLLEPRSPRQHSPSGQQSPAKRCSLIKRCRMMRIKVSRPATPENPDM